MKKYILVALFMNLTTAFSYSQVRINVQGGAGFNSITKSDSYDGNFGFRFGVGVDIPLVGNWSFQTGLQFLNRKSTADKYAPEYIQHKGQEALCHRMLYSQINAVYFQLPIKIAAYLPINPNCGLQISAGPYISYGIVGNTDIAVVQHVTLTNDGSVTDFRYWEIHWRSNFETFDKDNGVRRFDIGIGIGADFKYKSFFIGCGVEHGLFFLKRTFPKDVLKAVLDRDRTTVAPRNFGVEFHVGYSFCVGK